MKLFALLLSVLALLFFFGCKKGSDLVEPKIQEPTYFSFTVAGYGENIEPNYRKVYSDSTWEQYDGVTQVSGTDYITLKTNKGDRYYYSTVTGKYAGYQANGLTAIIFDSPMDFLPNVMRSDQPVTRTATFTVSGIRATMTSTMQLADTNRVNIRLGSFFPTVHFKSSSKLTATNGEHYENTSESWLAKGPGGIVTITDGGAPVEFVYGYVNGKSWPKARMPEVLPEATSLAQLTGIFRGALIRTVQ